MQENYFLQKMRRPSSWSLVHILSVILSCYTILILSSLHGCSARDTITINSRLDDEKNQTLVSAGNRFVLGFFSPSGSSNVKRYVGIWYSFSPQTVVWVANRQNPLSDKSGVLSIADGKLKLSDKKGKLYWSTQTGGKGLNLLPVAKLNDTGNLILFDERLRENIWQSFRQPTDTFLFGMNMDNVFGLTSWASKEDPALGNFTFKQDPEGQVVMERSITYWRSGTRESNQISKSDEWPPTIGNFLNFSENSTEAYKNKRLVMNFTGDLQYWEFDTDMKHWTLVWLEPKNNCSKYNFCGNFGVCNANNKLPCKCLPGFKPKFSEKWNAGDFSDGCSRNSPSSCGDDFLSLKRMKVGHSDSSYDAKDDTDCKMECLKNCLCQAYSFVGQRDYTTSCLIWTEDLKNLQEDQDGGYDLQVRVVPSDIGTLLFTYPRLIVGLI